jgi:hypothetical protein
MLANFIVAHVESNCKVCFDKLTTGGFGKHFGWGLLSQDPLSEASKDITRPLVNPEFNSGGTD